ncbi:MAG: N,N-dimethylformamidase beta subunit family domain-containing protein [Myxococcota bacterium]
MQPNSSPLSFPYLGSLYLFFFACTILLSLPASSAYDTWYLTGEPGEIATLSGAQGWSSYDRYPRMLADLDGDGRSEIVGFGFNTVFIRGLESSISFAGGGLMTVADGWPSQDQYPRVFGDVDGDGRDDLVGFHETETTVLLSTGAAFTFAESFAAFSVADGWTTYDSAPRFLGDWDGDGREDLIGSKNGEIWVSISTPSGFAPAYLAGLGFDPASGWTSADLYPRAVGDITGDQRADLIGFGQLEVLARPSDGVAVGASVNLSQLGLSGMTRDAGFDLQSTHPRFIADMNGDGLEDIIGIREENILVQLRVPGPVIGFEAEYAMRYGNFTALRGWGSPQDIRLIADLDGDDAADVAGANLDGLSWLLNKRRDMPYNPVVFENLKPGTSEWKVSCPAGLNCRGDDQTGQVEAYFGKTTINAGESIDLFLSTSIVANVTLELFRYGYYGGAGARLITTLQDIPGSPQPACPLDAGTGRVECAWSVTHALQTDPDWVSGIYLAKITRTDGYLGYAIFTLREDDRPATFLYQQPVTTYQAYNNFPAGIGKSFYNYNSGNAPASQVSFDRPYSAREGRGQFGTWEHDLVMWLESEGYDVAYSTNMDLDQASADLERYSGFLSTGHDEYWTVRMYDKVYDARRAGVDLAFFGSNAVYWRILLTDNPAGEPQRRMSRNSRFRDVGSPEENLMGVQYVRCCRTNGNTDFVVEPNTLKGMDQSTWLFAGTGIETGDVIPRIVGYEIDARFNPSITDPEISDFTLLSNSIYDGSPSHASIFRDISGSYTFASGTMSWSWALAIDDSAVRPHTGPGGSPVDSNRGIAAITRNLLDRFEESPAPAPIPEPGFGILLAVGALALAGRRPAHRGSKR